MIHATLYVDLMLLKERLGRPIVQMCKLKVREKSTCQERDISKSHVGTSRNFESFVKNSMKPRAPTRLV